MARLRLGLAGLFLIVLAAIGFELGDPAIAGPDIAVSEPRETQSAPGQPPAEGGALAASMSADDPDDDLVGAEAVPRPPASLVRQGAARIGAVVAHRHPRPRATGPPSLSIA